MQILTLRIGLKKLKINQRTDRNNRPLAKVVPLPFWATRDKELS